jgi:hypothetical protein
VTTTPPAGTEENAARPSGSTPGRPAAGAPNRSQRPKATATEPAPVRTPSPASRRTPSSSGTSSSGATTSSGSTSTGQAPTVPAAAAATAAATVSSPAPSTRAGSTVSRKGTTQSAGPKRVMGYRRQRFEARKVRRLIRHIDPWSMLKLAVLVSLCMWLITMIACVILWTVADSSGTISSIENFVNSSLQLQDWKLDGEFLFRQFGLITLLMSLGFAAALVVASLVFNLISDIIGGVWISVIEEETARPVAEGTARPDR